MTIDFPSCASDTAEDGPSSRVAAYASASVRANHADSFHALLDGTQVTIRAIRPQGVDREPAAETDRRSNHDATGFLGSTCGPSGKSAPRTGLHRAARRPCFHCADAARRHRAGDRRCPTRPTPAARHANALSRLPTPGNGAGPGTLLLRQLMEVARSRRACPDVARHRREPANARSGHVPRLSLRSGSNDAAQVIHALVLQEATFAHSIEEARTCHV